MTIVSETEHVQVFKINIKINRMKHSAGGIGCAVTSWNSVHAIRLALLEVVERCRCRMMFAVQSHERLPESRRSSCSGRWNVVVQVTKK